MRRSTQITISAALSLSLLAGCTAGDSASGDAVAAAGAGAAVPAAAVDSSTSGYGAVGTLDSGVVHTIDISFDEEDYAQLIDAYLSSGDKEWIEATVTIDGSTYEQAGIRLKGNSSLFSLSAASDAGLHRVLHDAPPTWSFDRTIPRPHSMRRLRSNCSNLPGWRRRTRLPLHSALTARTRSCGW